MSQSMRDDDAAAKGNLVALDDGGEDMNLVLVRRLLRASIDESRWKDAAVADAIGLKGASGAAYFSKMLAGEKPITARHLRALPDDIEAIFARKYAESFGLIVVVPSTGADAVRNLVSGLFGVLGAATAMPERADKMAKANLDTPRRTRRA